MRQIRNKKGESIVTVIVSFMLMLIMLAIFQGMVRASLNIAQRASENSVLHEEAFGVASEGGMSAFGDVEITFQLADKSISTEAQWARVDASLDDSRVNQICYFKSKPD